MTGRLKPSRVAAVLFNKYNILSREFMKEKQVLPQTLHDITWHRCFGWWLIKFTGGANYGNYSSSQNVTVCDPLEVRVPIEIELFRNELLEHWSVHKSSSEPEVISLLFSHHTCVVLLHMCRIILLEDNMSSYCTANKTHLLARHPKQCSSQDLPLLQWPLFGWGCPLSPHPQCKIEAYKTRLRSRRTIQSPFRPIPWRLRSWIPSKQVTLVVYLVPA